MYWSHPHFPGSGPIFKPQKQKSLEEKNKGPGLKKPGHRAWEKTTSHTPKKKKKKKRWGLGFSMAHSACDLRLANSDL